MLALALLVASAPRLAVIPTPGMEPMRDAVEAALAARTDVELQPRALVDEVLAANSAAGLVCAADDVPCWGKIGLDGGFELVLLIAAAPDGAAELRLLGLGDSRELRRAPLPSPGDAANAVALALTPARAPENVDSPPLGSEPTPPPNKPADATRDKPLVAAPPTPPRSPPQGEVTPGPPVSAFTIGAVAAGVIGAACGVAAAVLDDGLSKSMIDARDRNIPVDVESFKRTEGTQDLLLGCTGAAGALAIAAGVVAVVSE